MAFMVPIIKPGWNLYNCNPPPGRVRYTKRIVVVTGKSSLLSSADADSNSNKKAIPVAVQQNKAGSGQLPVTGHISGRRITPPDFRTCRNPNPRMLAPLKLVHVRPTKQGLYQLTAYSTDSLFFRNLDVAMQVIPEETEEDDISSSENSSTDSRDTSTMCLVSSNPELPFLRQPSEQRRVPRLLARFRKLFRLTSSGGPSANLSGKEERKSRKLPAFMRNFQRCRS